MTAEPWQDTSRLSVCFGHQSVGGEIVDALLRKVGSPVTVRWAHAPQDFGAATFAHFRVGRNGEPLSKCAHFARVLEDGAGDRVDIALFKFCYVDITASTDVDDLFHVYHDTMSRLSRTFPQVVFLHTTVPLRRLAGGRMGWLRSRIGWFDRAMADQAKRHAYNERLRSVYAGSGSVFDLAALETTHRDGTPSSTACGRDELPSLVPQYTKDGGHLTPSAAGVVAEHLVTLLASAATRRQGGSA